VDEREEMPIRAEPVLVALAEEAETVELETTVAL
jgi:hypothetical protein